MVETEDERAALDREAELIHHYGPTQLVNRTFGGEMGPRPRHRNTVANERAAQLVDQFFKPYRRPVGDLSL